MRLWVDVLSNAVSFVRVDRPSFVVGVAVVELFRRTVLLMIGLRTVLD